MKFLEKNAGTRYSSIGGCELGIPEGRLKAKEFNRHFRAQEVRTLEGDSMTQQTVIVDAAANLRDRMHTMFMRDCVSATILVVVLWLTILFVMLAVRPYMSHSVELACWLAAAYLLLLNTSSIVAMIRHYGHDKEHIYGIDIRHLDAGR